MGGNILRPSGVLLAAIKPTAWTAMGNAHVRALANTLCVSNTLCVMSTNNCLQMPNLVLKGSAEMKHLLASITIGACLLLPSAAAVLGPGPPTKPAQNPATGQHGSNHAPSCTTSGTG